MGVKNKTYYVRYFTYYINFPKDNDEWVDQVPFIHDLQFELKNTTFGKDPKLCRDILTYGECRWTDNNGIIHRVKIEEQAKPRRWGTKREL
jgi:hypothetical protein